MLLICLGKRCFFLYFTGQVAAGGDYSPFKGMTLYNIYYSNF